MRLALAKRYLRLAPAKAPSYWGGVRQPLLRARMEYEDEVAGGFLKWFPQLSLAGRDVFDVGSGYGGRAVRFAELGARRVVGLEPSASHCAEGRAFAHAKAMPQVTFVEGVGESLPFPDASFDVVTSYDVFEHVSDLGSVLDECERVLRPGGALYAVFPPYYHPTGAHLDAWLSRMPWANVLFGDAVLRTAAIAVLEERGDTFRPQRLRASDRLWGLNGATIGSVRKLLAGRRYAMELPPLFSPLNGKWEAWRMKYYAPFFAPLRHVPILREMFVHRIVLTVTKR